MKSYSSKLTVLTLLYGPFQILVRVNMRGVGVGPRVSTASMEDTRKNKKSLKRRKQARKRTSNLPAFVRHISTQSQSEQNLRSLYGSNKR